MTSSVPEALESLRADPHFERLYLGHETCPHLMPSLEEIEAIRHLTRIAGVGFTLVTPFLYQGQIDEFLMLIDQLRPLPGEEIVFNDLGLLAEIAAWELPGVRVMGRLLFPMEGDPLLIDYLRRQPGNRDFSPLLADPVPPRPILNLGIIRREIDSALTVLYPPESEKIPISLSFYHPLTILTASRLCPWARTDQGWPNLSSCFAPCRGDSVRLRDAPSGRDQILIGNAQYSRRPELPGFLPPVFDRLVLQSVPGYDCRVLPTDISEKRG